MIEITADMTTSPPTVTLSGAAASSIVEVRVQDTMSGQLMVNVVECDASGNATLDMKGISTAYNIYVATLDTNNNAELTHLVHSRASDTATMHLISEAAFAQMLAPADTIDIPADTPVVEFDNKPPTNPAGS